MAQMRRKRYDGNHSVVRIVPKRALIELSDGSQWTVHPGLQFLIDGWVIGDRIEIRRHTDSGKSLALTNVDTPGARITVHAERADEVMPDE